MKESRPEGSAGVYAGLRAAGVSFSVTIPDGTMFQVGRMLEEDEAVDSYVCSREDEGVAMAIGAYLGGRTPVALMEGSGVGMCGLILARAQIQRTPLLLLASHSLALGERFDFHGASRLAAEGVLRGLDIPYVVVTDRSQTAILAEQAIHTVMGQKTVVGLLYPPYVLAEQE